MRLHLRDLMSAEAAPTRDGALYNPAISMVDGLYVFRAYNFAGAENAADCAQGFIDEIQRRINSTLSMWNVEKLDATRKARPPEVHIGEKETESRPGASEKALDGAPVRETVQEKTRATGELHKGGLNGPE